MRVRNFEELIDFLYYVVLCAPNDFPKEDFLCDDKRGALDQAFDLIRDGTRFAAEKIADKSIIPALREELETSYQAYKSGEKKKGAHTLQHFRAALLENARKRRSDD